MTAGRTFDIFNQNGWGRSLHFLAAWVLVLAGLVYWLLNHKHFYKTFSRTKRELKIKLYWEDFMNHLKMKIANRPPVHYGLLQKARMVLSCSVLMPIAVLSQVHHVACHYSRLPISVKDVFRSAVGTHHSFLFRFGFGAVPVCALAVIFKTGSKRQIKSITLGSSYEEEIEHSKQAQRHW